MRSKDLGIIKNLSSTFSKKTSLELFRRVCVTRSFEFNVKKVYDQGKIIKAPIYLSVGQESIAAALSISFPDTYQFGQHRCHDLYLSYGGKIETLADELLHLSTGCAGGMGGSASAHSPTTRMFGHDGLMGTQIPIATGFALGSGEKTLAIMGDASAEEDYILPSLGYAATKKIPILFVCSDNGLSILTKVATRRSWKMVNVAKSFGMKAVEITDDPWLIMHHVNNFKTSLPAFLNIHTARTLWHAGTGSDGKPDWDRFTMIKKELKKLGLEKQVKKIEIESKKFVDNIWQQRLVKLNNNELR